MHFVIEAADGLEMPIEARAYLEFRLFSVLTRSNLDVFAVRVRVDRASPPGAPEEMRCRVQVLLRPDGELALERRAPRLYAAIDRVADALTAGADRPLRPILA
jgi:ribosome-associated translation inhibitor RaiA